MTPTVATAQSPAPTVDVLVVYTPASANEVGGAAAVATQAAAEIAKMNEMFDASGAHTRVQLVGVEMVSFTGGSSVEHDLLAAHAGGITGLSGLRAQTHADIVLLVGTSKPGCYATRGLEAYDLRGVENAFVSVLSRFCGFRDAIGRSLGLGRFPGADGAARPYAYGYAPFGHGVFGEPLFTFMGRGDCPGCESVNRLSAPVPFGNVLLGDAATADSVRAVDEASLFVAAYRGCTYSVGGSANVSVGAAGGDYHFAVTTLAGCPTGVPDKLPAWLSVQSNTDVFHTGSSVVTLRVAANDTYAQRSATVTVGTQAVSFTQAPLNGGVCSTAELRPTTVIAGGDDTSVLLEYRAPLGCEVTQIPTSLTYGGFPVTISASPPIRGYGDVWVPVRLPIVKNATAAPRTYQQTVAGAQVTIEQGAAGCTPTHFADPVHVPAGGTTQTWNATLPTGCAWTATDLPAWATVVGSAAGTGDVGLMLQVDSNAAAPRAGTFTITTNAGAHEVLVAQAGVSCQVAFTGVLSPMFAAAGSQAVLGVVIDGGCPWQVAQLPSWVQADVSGGVGPGPLTLTAAPNTDGLRSGVAVIGGTPLTVSQHAAPCTVAVGGLSGAVPSAGGLVTASVSSRAGCFWSAASDATWLDVDGASRQGSGQLVVIASPNTGWTRTATLHVGSEVFALTQPGPLGVSGSTGCATVTLSAKNLSREGQPVRALVRAPHGCFWTIESSVPWIAGFPPAPRSGDGEFQVWVGPNDTALLRTGQITVGGHTQTITQALGLPCSYGAAGAMLPADGGTAQVSVSTVVGCSWTIPASTNVPWLTIAEPGAQRSGPGPFTVIVEPNNTEQTRQTSFELFGNIVSFLQPQSTTCLLTLLPAHTVVPSAGGPVNAVFTLGAGCPWVASSLSPWITVTSATSGSGPATVQLTVDGSVGEYGRTGNVTINGKAFSVYQQAHIPNAPTRRFLAEGATGSFFDTTISLLNPYGYPVDATLTFLRSGAPPITNVVSMPPKSRRDVRPAEIDGLGQAEFSTVVDTTVPIVVDRQMRWGAPTWGSHGESAVVSPSLTWYLAEGATTGTFNLFYLIQNPAETAADVRVTYLRGGGLPPLVKSYVIPAESRQNIWVNVETFPSGDSEALLLASSEVSAVVEVQNGVPIIVERAMYMDRPGQLFVAGTNSAGVTTPATQWFLAEGATGSYFDMFVLVANPTTDVAVVEVEYLRSEGGPIAKTYHVPPQSRFNIWVDQEEFDGLGKALSDAAFSMTLTSSNGIPIIVERSMWWPGSDATWHEAHNSPGATATGTRWGIADAEHVPDEGVETYVLVANTSPYPASIVVEHIVADGGTVITQHALDPKSRFNVPFPPVNPDAGIRMYGVIVESVANGDGQVAEIVVERASYRNRGNQKWMAGSNALATRLQ